jgi:hypothetical protein
MPLIPAFHVYRGWLQVILGAFTKSFDKPDSFSVIYWVRLQPLKDINTCKNG